MSQPNILLITSDQQHWNTIGAFNPEIRTPNLDRLVADGTTFTRAYCPNPTCTPTRASILTGTYPSQHGAWTLGTKLPEETITLPDRLQQVGYRTALVGKAHFQPLASTPAYPSIEAYPTLQDLDFWRDFHGPFYGFEHVELARNHTNEAHVGQHYLCWLQDKGATEWREWFRPPTGTMGEQEFSWSIPEELHYDTWIAERSNAFLDERAADRQPFFLWSSFFDPHPPYLAPSPWDEMYDPDALTIPGVHPGEHDANPPHFGLTQQPDPDFSAWREDGLMPHGFGSHLRTPERARKLVAVYYGMVSLLDKYVGRILDRLRAHGMDQNTLVVFSTDHGHLFGQHGLQAKGAFHYEDLIRVPLLARLPGRIPAGRRTAGIQSLVDFAPTVLDLIGRPVPPDMTGLSQRPVWEGETESVREHALVENHHTPTTLNLRTYVEQRYKITVYRGQEYGELFDLERDPGEQHNLWNDPGYDRVKSDLLLRFVWAELGRDLTPTPRTAIA